MSKWVTPTPLPTLPPGKTITKREAIAMLRAGGYSLPKALAAVAFMAWSTPSNQSTGDLITAAIWNQNVVANVQYNYSYKSMELISATELSGTQASVTFSSIPATFEHLMLHIQARGDNNSGTAREAIKLNFNNDTTAVYDYVNNDVTTGVSVARSTGQTTISMKSMTDATIAADIFGSIWLWIMNYQQTTNDKNVYWYSTCGRTSNFGMIQGGGAWYNATPAAISEIDLVPTTSSNFTAGSNFYLYGIDRTGG